jgi:hypothetical protein
LNKAKIEGNGISLDANVLRQRLHEAVDEVLARASAEEEERKHTIYATHLADRESFEYVWPTLDPEYFSWGSQWALDTPAGRLNVIIGWTVRPAWGREERQRAVVFQQVGGSEDPKRWYPWTEFVETDDGRYAAPIPLPSRPRAVLRDGERIPSRFADNTVERADALFGSIRNGPSLRLVVEKNEQGEMAQHGYWVAGLRGRV